MDSCMHGKVSSPWRSHAVRKPGGSPPGPGTAKCQMPNAKWVHLALGIRHSKFARGIGVKSQHSITISLLRRHCRIRVENFFFIRQMLAGMKLNMKAALAIETAKRLLNVET